ncbi:outer membrane protein assembly factor BamD [Tenacibaculum finnmarkense genomovar finnmarkense]|uniref:outer membrane protein assembly factor BamD n=1 Tax=Tenacibaculum finnmarkense TaxID=2781243 RepID=UPI001E5CAD3E|nr:outer membrane protein assembly factor BamD [Tenacibaculum finnmarkense]MCD8418432.1 outer membrane protein assembly factor BamD [Tenacibaculum finnmarkense genomovar finnmarkense]MCG8186732.1 outer membrane protein assembly factor BamD [Tenacibaculum finnmarkense genomovar finnmarkense]MCG8203242.1 outer membrane protein assembly factor BamD [Tenacibaculum finnmarkense genomovar finnmarkense]MCG8210639.1 outer membrane protein assembly factor BamD [Tenacibaculum finnmarkense genomovar finnm
MQKIKNLAYLLVMLLVLSSCGEYNKVLNKGSIQEQYKMALKMYEVQKYSKALRLFEKVTPSYRGKPQMERIQYMVSQSNFNEKNYSLAGYYFNRFAKNYPKSSKKEDAAFLSALSYYKAAPSFSLDPTDTNKALASFQSFIDAYPNSNKLDEANKYYTELRSRLEKKAFEIAKTYYNTAGYDSRNYRAAITAFDNLLSDYLGTKYKEEALYFRLKAAHDFAMKSTQRRKAVRIKAAINAYDKLNRSFPESKFIKDSNAMLAALNKEQEQLVKS